MLDVTPIGLWKELEAAEEQSEAFFKDTKRRVERFTGPYYRADKGALEHEADPENHLYEYISLVLPQMVFSNPRVQVKTARQGSQQDVATIMRLALNRWIEDVDLRKDLGKFGVEYLLGMSVGIVGLEERDVIEDPELAQGLGLTPGEPRSWPQLRYIPSEWYRWDPAANGSVPPRFGSHLCVRDKEGLLREASEFPDRGWNEEAIEALTPDAGLDKLERRGTRDLPKREEVVFYEMWVPEYELEDSPGAEEGYHGTIFTVPVYASSPPLDANERKSWLREPRPYYGPPEGPYVVGGYLHVPGEYMPLAPTTAVESEIRNLNRHVRALQRAGARHKQIGIGGGGLSEDDTRRINNTKDGNTVHVEGFDPKSFSVYEFAGITDSHLVYSEQQRDRLNRLSGMSDAMRGQVQGGSTATENAIAAESAGARMAYLIQGFHDFAKDILDRVGWHLYHEDEVVFPLGEEAATELGIPEPWFRGGMHGEGSGASYRDLELRLEPYSMTRTSEGLQQRRMLEMTQLVLQAVQVAATLPPGAFDIEEYLDKAGEAYNMPELGSLVNADLLGVQEQPRPMDSEPLQSKQAGAYGTAERRVGPALKQLQGGQSGQVASQGRVA